ncbi:MAG: DUF1552 domain-containing protein [Planctomycetaceae bacterium]
MTSRSSTNTSTASARWNDESPPSKRVNRRPPWRRQASARPNATTPTRLPSSQNPRGGQAQQYMQVMCDLNVLAFQTDTTRVSTYIGSTPNGVSYPELGFTDKHHSQTHHENREEMVSKVAAITKFNIDQFAYMVNKMANLHEGDGTLLDNFAS